MKVELGTTQNINTSYSGTRSSRLYVSAAVLGGETLASGTIDIRDNIQYKEVIQDYKLRMLI